jgi:hypothetical protein
MFGFCQESSGRYFGDETEAETALELKKKAAEARGRSHDDVELRSLKDFFAAKFGSD